jgi:uncharacterized membrane protein YjdF
MIVNLFMNDNLYNYMSKRTLGITRNKFERLAHYKQNGHHTYKKNTIAGSR